MYLTEVLFALVKYVPDWVPGTGWKSVVKERRRTLDRLRDYPYEVVKQQLVNIIARNPADIR